MKKLMVAAVLAAGMGVWAADAEPPTWIDISSAIATRKANWTAATSGTATYGAITASDRVASETATAGSITTSPWNEFFSDYYRFSNMPNLGLIIIFK